MHRSWLSCLIVPVILALPVFSVRGETAPSLSGIYPHLAMFNQENECGTGAVVPWAGRLWAVTYAPHKPSGSTDKLYEITPDLEQIIRPESIGGTPANRMIHRESGQLFIGPYAIDRERQVRVIPYQTMFGRPTGNARHLFDPTGRLYGASMEEGIYEIDVRDLKVTEHFADEAVSAPRRKADLPGYHGKGLYSGQGVLVYANNGEHGREAQRRPDVPSGVLAEWDGRAEYWTIVRRNQFTEVTGPGGLYGNPDPANDPIWASGWDHRSLLLGIREAGTWSFYRLPKASHSYDGAHGWNTEWPRIRDIGEDDLLMTMHGMFWRFPPSFRRASSAGMAPRSSYLKVIGDFCRWQDRLVFGCDDTAKSEFLNTGRAKGKIEPPGQSQSNLWFTDPDLVNQLGPPLGRGAVWLQEPVTAGVPSDPFLFDGFAFRSVHLKHGGGEPVTFRFEVDRAGNGAWTPLKQERVGAEGSRWLAFSEQERGAWVRIVVDRDASDVTAFFHYSARDTRGIEADARFAGLARPGQAKVTGGLIRARGADKRSLHFAAMRPGAEGPEDIGYYELDATLSLNKVDDPKAHRWLKERVAIPRDILDVDEASVLYVDDEGKRWRLPKGDPAFDKPGALGAERIDREVATERDLFNAHGTFYELPARNAGGFAKIRPVTTHLRRIKDYGSYRGLLILAGIADDAPDSNPHILRSGDGRCALWAGAVDDLWTLGKPRGYGGPWNDTPVKADRPSDPYLMTGYDRKALALRHDQAEPVHIRVEVDVSGTGTWCSYRTFEVPADLTTSHTFPEAFQAYWVRTVADRDARVTVQLRYE